MKSVWYYTIQSPKAWTMSWLKQIKILRVSLLSLKLLYYQNYICKIVLLCSIDIVCTKKIWTVFSTVLIISLFYRAFLSINPMTKGSKMEKRFGKRVSMHPKILKLLNKLRDYNSPWHMQIWPDLRRWIRRTCLFTHFKEGPHFRLIYYALLSEMYFTQAFCT
jgi:hypothetical protein